MPYQSQRTSDIDAKIASYSSDLAVESPPYEALKAKSQLNEAERNELALRKARVKSIKDDLADLTVERATSVAEDGSEANVALCAGAWKAVGEVAAVHADVATTHATRLDQHLGAAASAAGSCHSGGKDMANDVTDAIRVLAKNDYLAADRSVGTALSRLRMCSPDNARALANWFQKITRAHGCESAIAPYLTFHYGIDSTTCLSVAEEQSKFVAAKLEQAIRDNGLEPAHIAPERNHLQEKRDAAQQHWEQVKAGK